MNKMLRGLAALGRILAYVQRCWTHSRSWAMALLLIAALPACGAVATSLSYALRVQDGTGQPIGNAKVTLDVPGKAPLDEFTDTNGYTKIAVGAIYVGQPGVLRVEATGYQAYVKNIDVTEDALPEVIQLAASGQAPIGSPANPPAAIADTPAATSPAPSAAIRANRIPPIDWGGFDKLFIISDLNVEQHVPMPSADGSVIMVANALTFIAEARENLQSYSVICTFSFFDKDNIQISSPSVVSLDPFPASWEPGTRSHGLIILPEDMSQVVQIRGSS
jgi:hypothetical protein